MAFKSAKQQRYLFSQKPRVALSKKYSSTEADKIKEKQGRKNYRKSTG